MDMTGEGTDEIWKIGINFKNNKVVLIENFHILESSTDPLVGDIGVGTENLTLDEVSVINSVITSLIERVRANKLLKINLERTDVE